jgi:cobalt-zinc-cadmium efflux system membrane fusion protein
MRLGEVLQAPGEVVDNAYGVTLITPRVAALVVRRHAKLGDEVAVGAALVTLSSVEVAEAQGELRIAEQEWKRGLRSAATRFLAVTPAAVAVERPRQGPPTGWRPTPDRRMASHCPRRRPADRTTL